MAHSTGDWLNWAIAEKATAARSMATSAPSIQRAISEVRLLSDPTPEWFCAMAALRRQTNDEAEIYRRVVGQIAIPAAFATLDGRWKRRGARLWRDPQRATLLRIGDH